MKYKFTGKEKKYLGRTLKQIVCVTAFANIAVGDIGGWLESDSNLNHAGNAWVSGDARVSGDAEVCGNARVYGNAEVCTKKAYTISTNHYHVTITDTHITIGCQNRVIDFWRKAKRKDIAEMDGKESAENWFKYKKFILALEQERNGEH